MRQKREKQRPLSPPWPDHQLANELKVISRILDDNPQTLELIVQDLSDRVDSSVGAPGLTAEQVLRCAVIKQLHQFSYRKLEFHLVDSQSCQRFCRLPYGASISKATLAENLGKIEPGTWKAINDHLVRWAQARGLEKGQRIRVDATAVQTNVHYPLDSELLYDGIRVVTRWLGRLRDWEGIGFVDHTRRAKRRVLNIRNRRGKKRLDSYRDLIKVASKTAHYAEQALAASAQWSDPSVWPGRRNWPTIWSCCTKSSSRLNDGSFRARPSRPRRRSVPSSKSTPILSRRALGKRSSATRCLSARGPRR